MKSLFKLWLLMTLFTLFGCKDEATESQETQTEHSDTFAVEPFQAAPPSESRRQQAAPPAQEQQPAASPSTQPQAVIAFTKTPLASPAAKKVPRISIVGPEGAQIALKVFFDDQLICTLSGQIDAKTHRLLRTQQFIVDGVCHSDKIKTQGQHEYRLAGHILLPAGEPQEVSLTTGQHDMTHVIEPIIVIHEQGAVNLQLAVG